MLQRNWLKRELLANGYDYSVECKSVDAPYEIRAEDWTSGVVDLLKEQWGGIKRHAKKLYGMDNLDERMWTALICGAGADSEADQPSAWTKSLQKSGSTVNEEEQGKLAELMLKACVVLSKGDAESGFIIMPSRMHGWWGQILGDDMLLGNHRLAVDEGDSIVHTVRKDLFMDKIGGKLAYLGASDGTEYEVPMYDPFLTGNESDGSDEAAHETQAVVEEEAADEEDDDSEDGEGIEAAPIPSDHNPEQTVAVRGEQASSDDDQEKQHTRATKRKRMEALSDDDDERETSPSKSRRTTADLDVISKWVKDAIDKGWRGAGDDESYEKFIRELVNAYTVETAVQTGFMAELKRTMFAKEGLSDEKILKNYLFTSMIPLSMAHRR